MPSINNSDLNNFDRFQKSIQHIISNPKEVASIYKTYQEAQKSNNLFSWIKLVFKAAIFAIRDTSLIPLAQEYMKGNLNLEDILQNDKTWELLSTHKDKVYDLLSALKTDIDQKCGTDQINIREITKIMLDHPKELANMYRLYNDISTFGTAQEINNLHKAIFPDKQSANIATQINNLIDLHNKSQTTSIPGVSDNATLIKRIQSVYDNFHALSPNQLANQVKSFSRVTNLTPPPNWLQLGTHFIDFINKDSSLSNVISNNSQAISDYVQNLYQTPEQKQSLLTMGVTDPKILEIIAPMLSQPAILKKLNDSYNQGQWQELVHTTFDFALQNPVFDHYLQENSQNITNSVKHFLTINPNLTQAIPYGIADNNLQLFNVVGHLLKHPKTMKETIDQYNIWSKDPKFPITLLIGKVMEVFEDPKVEKFVQDNSKQLTKIIESYLQANPEQANSTLKPYNFDPSLIKITDVLFKYPQELKSIVNETNKEAPNYIQIVNTVITIAKSSPELDSFLKDPNNQKNFTNFVTTMSSQAGFPNTRELSNLILGQLPNLESWSGYAQVAKDILLNQGPRAEVINILANNKEAVVDYIAQKTAGNSIMFIENEELSSFINSALASRLSKTTNMDLKDVLIQYVKSNEIISGEVEKLYNGNMSQVILKNVAFNNLTIKNFKFTGSIIQGGSFKNTKFLNTDFSDMVFKNEQEKNPYTNQIVYKSTDFSGATFDPETLQTLLPAIRNSLKVATRANINLDNVKLIGDFSGMDLSQLSFKNSDFSQAKLEGVNLANCNLYNANISAEQLHSSSNLSNVILDKNKNFKDIALTQVLNDITRKITHKQNINNSNSHEFASNFKASMQKSLQNKPQFAEYLIELQQLSQNYPRLNVIENYLTNAIKVDNNNNLQEVTDQLMDDLFSFKIATNIAHELFRGGEKLNQGRIKDTLELANHLAQTFKEIKKENTEIDLSQFINNESTLSGHLEFNITGKVSASSGLSKIYYDKATQYTKAGYLTGGIQIKDLTSQDLKDEIKSYVKATLLDPNEKSLIKDLSENIATNIAHQLFQGGEKTNQGRINDTVKLTQHLSQIFSELKKENPEINFEHLLDKKTELSGHIEYNKKGNVTSYSGLTKLYYDMGTEYTKIGYFSGGIQINDLTSKDLKNAIKSYLKAEAILEPEEKNLIKEVATNVIQNLFGNKISTKHPEGNRILQHLMGVFAEIKNIGINIKELISNKKESIVGSLPNPSGLNVPNSLTEIYYQETQGSLSLSIPAKNFTQSLSDKAINHLIAHNNDENITQINTTATKKPSIIR